MLILRKQYQNLIRNKFVIVLDELKEQGFTQTSIAGRIGMTQGAISHMKEGITAVSLNMIVSIAREFDVPFEKLFPDDWVRTPAARNAEARWFYLTNVCSPNKERTILPNFIKFGITKDPAKRILRLQDKSAHYWHEYAVLYEFSKPHIAAAIETVFQSRKTDQGEYINMSIGDARRLAYEAYNGLAKPVIHEPPNVSKFKWLN